MANISKGAAGEVLAARFLRDLDYDILAANYRCRFGETDIIAANEEYIAFVEVKTRAADAWYTPREAVDPAKQARLYKTALYFLSQHPTDLQPRFDVIEVTADPSEPLRALQIEHLKNVF